MSAGQLVGAVDGGIAGLAEESIVGGAEPPGALAQAAVTGSSGLACHGICSLLLGDHCKQRRTQVETVSKENKIFSYDRPQKGKSVCWSTMANQSSE